MLVIHDKDHNDTSANESAVTADDSGDVESGGLGVEALVAVVVGVVALVAAVIVVTVFLMRSKKASAVER